MVGLVLIAGATATAWAKDPAKSTPDVAATTVGDLAKRNAGNIQVHPDANVSGGAAKAMQGYSEFLKLQNTDEHLRAQALRRLGDLSLDSGDLERMSNEVAS